MSHSVIEGTLGELATRDQLGNHKIGVRITLAVGVGGQIDGHASRGLCKIRTLVEIEAPKKILIRFAGAAVLCHDHAGTVSTSPQRNTHISERRTVHYPWHPWHDRSVFIDGRVETNGRVIFRCHVEETQQWRALEIPDWMFGSVCSTMGLVDTPAVACEALRRLKGLLSGASNHDPTVKEAQRFEGGVDETDTESETIAVGIVPAVNSHPSVGSNSIGGEAKNHPVTVTIDATPLGEPTRPREQRGRR